MRMSFVKKPKLSVTKSSEEKVKTYGRVSVGDRFDDVFCGVTYEVIALDFCKTHPDLPPTIRCKTFEYQSSKAQHECGIMYFAAVAHMDRDWKTMGLIRPESWSEPYRSRFLGVSVPETGGFRIRLRRLSRG